MSNEIIKQTNQNKTTKKRKQRKTITKTKQTNEQKKKKKNKNKNKNKKGVLCKFIRVYSTLKGVALPHVHHPPHLSYNQPTKQTNQKKKPTKTTEQ
jgi:hypothetical protein